MDLQRYQPLINAMVNSGHQYTFDISRTAASGTWVSISLNIDEGKQIEVDGIMYTSEKHTVNPLGEFMMPEHDITDELLAEAIGKVVGVGDA